MDGRAGLPCGLRGEGRGGMRRQGCCLIRWKRAPEKLNMDENAVASTIEEIHKGMGAPLNYNSEDSLRSTVRCACIACDEEFIRIVKK